MVKGDALQRDHATLTELPLTLERLNCALHGTLTLPKGASAGMAVLLLAGASHAAGRVIRRQLAEAGVSSSWQAQAGRILDELEAGRGVAKVPSELMALFRPSVQPYLMSWLSLDPAAELARAPLDALVVQGNADFQVGAEDAQRLVQARPGNSLAIIDGMNHVLKDAPSERVANLATYSRPDLPLTAELVPLLAAYLLDK